MLIHHEIHVFKIIYSPYSSAVQRLTVSRSRQQLQIGYGYGQDFDQRTAAGDWCASTGGCRCG
jgi:hypothetical protein